MHEEEADDVEWEEQDEANPGTQLLEFRIKWYGK